MRISDWSSDVCSSDLQAADAAEAHRVLTLADISGLSAKDHHTDLKVDIHQSLLDRINLAALETMTREQIQREIGELVYEQLANTKHALNATERRQLVEDILDELLGLGPDRKSTRLNSSH